MTSARYPYTATSIFRYYCRYSYDTAGFVSARLLVARHRTSVCIIWLCRGSAPAVPMACRGIATACHGDPRQCPSHATTSPCHYRGTTPKVSPTASATEIPTDIHGKPHGKGHGNIHGMAYDNVHGKLHGGSVGRFYFLLRIAITVRITHEKNNRPLCRSHLICVGDSTLRYSRTKSYGQSSRQKYELMAHPIVRRRRCGPHK